MYAMAMSSDRAKPASEKKRSGIERALRGRSGIERHCGAEVKQNRASTAGPGTEPGVKSASEKENKMGYQEAYDKLEKYGQLHVLKYYDDLSGYE